MSAKGVARLLGGAGRGGVQAPSLLLAAGAMRCLATGTPGGPGPSGRGLLLVRPPAGLFWAGKALLSPNLVIMSSKAIGTGLVWA